MLQKRTVKRINHVSRFLDWLGRAKAENDAINTLTDQLQLARGEAAKYRESANMWKATARQISDDLEKAQPLIAYANRVKASKARYELKRRAK